MIRECPYCDDVFTTLAERELHYIKCCAKYEDEIECTLNALERNEKGDSNDS